MVNGMKNNHWNVKVDQNGHLILPAQLAEKIGIHSGDSLLVQENQDSLILSRPVHTIARVNIELTNQCNLNCLTCMRNTWEETAGYMTESTFSRILEDIKTRTPVPMVFFGGFGEPLLHPNLIEMVQAVKAAGARAELITNGTLLDDRLTRRLVELQLDRLWVSLDGANPDCYADVRLGAALPLVISNMKNLYHHRFMSHSSFPQIGVAFVAMQRNISDLPELIHLSTQFGAKYYSISNVLPHTPALRQEMLYRRSMYDAVHLKNDVLSNIDLPRMDPDITTLQVYGDLLRSSYSTNLGPDHSIQRVNTCPFLAKGSVSVRWDGRLSPCLPLLHTHPAYLDDRLRISKEFFFGSVTEQELSEIWDSPEYRDFRVRLQTFDFSPCVMCNSCEMANDNNEDCFGNSFPACGGCLWAQGLIQCP